MPEFSKRRQESAGPGRTKYLAALMNQGGDQHPGGNHSKTLPELLDNGAGSSKKGGKTIAKGLKGLMGQ